MRSQSTRHVLRRLLVHQAARPLCPLQSLPRPSASRNLAGKRVLRISQQRRTFLNFLQKPPRTLKAPDVEPGYEALLRYGSHDKENLRPPPREELLKGFREFFKYKRFNGRPVNSFQVQAAYKVFRHLIIPFTSEKGGFLSVADLRTARDTLLILPPRDDPAAALNFSKALYHEIRKQISAPDRKASAAEKNISPEALELFDMIPLLRTLAQNGRAAEARDLLLEQWPHLKQASDIDIGRIKGLWTPVLRGLAREGREEEMLAFVETMKTEAGISYTQSVHEIITRFYAQRDDVARMMAAFEKPIEPNDPPRQLTYSDALRCAIRHNERDWAMSVYQGMANSIESLSNPNHVEQAVILLYQFAVLLMGKGPEYLEQMFKVQYEKYNLEPSMKIMNALIEAATEKKDAYLAERLTTLVFKLGLEPDRQFYSQQIDYRVAANDLDGAFTSYRSLQNFKSDNEDWPVLNRLIRALCVESSPRHESILEITSFLEEQHVTLEPDTVVSICMAFLKNDEQYEVIDTLSLHTIHLNLEDRQNICQAFVDYCIDKSNSTARVWDAYALIRQFFPDVKLESRVLIMNAFFERKRADMACQVFGHMRQHSNPNYRPNADTYIRCLEGLGQCPDAESLKMVHNMLKMDTTVRLTTAVYNALMIAYTACDDVSRALDYWKEISRSQEGPSYQSLEIIFRAYEFSPYGVEAAQSLWDKVRKMEIEIPVNVYTAYAGVLGAHSQLEQAKELLENMETEVHQRPQPVTLAVVYNALGNDDLKGDFEAWAKDHFPHVWSSLEKTRRKRDAEGLMRFQISRPWKA
ncbi:complex I intermediate-associated protein 84- mitochondrial [Apiospora marii]|uniref:complex I intermediate-associated protein 84- mitochondrial n=1 Tax=Apiospora marii TaxID=335849 RepID=UPI003130DAA0